LAKQQYFEIFAPIDATALKAEVEQ